MKKLSLLIIALLTLTACQLPVQVENEVTNFEECVSAGNPVMESYPRQCRHGDQHFVEEVDVPVEPPTDDRKPCNLDYRPVCGEVQVQCIKAPCPPLKTTFSNRCEAENSKATNIVEGECVDESPNLEGACLSFDGKWLPKSNECEGMAPEMCDELGGTYNECASACRNDPNAEICTLQCILVCQF